MLKPQRVTLAYEEFISSTLKRKKSGAKLWEI